MKTSITASMLYDLVQCPYRVTMDLFEDFTKRDPINRFVQLLWEKGNAFEQEVIEGLQGKQKGRVFILDNLVSRPARRTAGRPSRKTAGRGANISF